MKHKKYIERILLLITSAAFMSFSVCANLDKDILQSKRYESSGLTKVIVRVRDGGGSGTKNAEEYLRRIYPELKIESEYSKLIKGFSCKIPTEIIDEAQRSPYIDSVDKCVVFQKADTVKSENGSQEQINNSQTEYTGKGQVIAVLDSELDTSHDMFKPIDTGCEKLSKKDIEKILKSDKLNAEADKRVYLNSKLPFVYSYTNDDDHYDVSVKKASGFHGTHVCGIAAGNRVNSPKGNISGIAPDAQLVFMGIFEYNKDLDRYLTDDSMVIAALEDAVMLKVDAINMSFGEDTEVLAGSAYDVACKNAQKEGVAIFAAAGNSSSTNFGVRNPDDSTLLSPSSINGVMSVASRDNEKKPNISVFSSKGVSQSLELKPDITELGEDIYSSFSGNKYQKMSGTSMASPRLAGTYLLMSEHISRLYPGVKNSEKSRLIQNMLMSTGEILTDDKGITVSPRYQGAGLADLEKAENCKVLLTGSEGQSKINLYDKLSDTFTLSVNIENLSDKNISFKNAKLSVITDGAEKSDTDGGKLISGSQKLKFTADLSQLKTIGAKEKKSCSVKVKLDKNQLKAVGRDFSNGFFIEGFIMLSGADDKGCPDVSIPFLGFYGDWGKVPIFAEDAQTQFETGCKNQTVTQAGGELIQLGINSINGKEVSDIYISPNDDGLADVLGFDMNDLRESVETGINIYDKSGNIVYNIETDECINRGYSNKQIIAGELLALNELNDGEEYTAELYGKINYKGAQRQNIKIDFKVDKTLPKIEYAKVYRKDGREILEAKFSDESRLDGAYLIGKGKGGILGKFEPGSPDKYDNKLNVLANMTSIPTDTEALKRQGYNFADILDEVSKDGKSIVIKYDITDLKEYVLVAADGGMNSVLITSDISRTPKTPPPVIPPQDQSSKTPSDSSEQQRNEITVQNPNTGSRMGLIFVSFAVTFTLAVVSARRRKK